MESNTLKIMFVCLGNICRSPAAEGIMKKMAGAAGLGWQIDSCGLISYHEGERPDSRMLAAAREAGYALSHRARKISPGDFALYDLIIGMDGSNVGKLKSICPPEHQGKIHLVSDYFVNAAGQCVPDPYYGSMEDFRNTISLLEDACAGLISRAASL